MNYAFHFRLLLALLTTLGLGSCQKESFEQELRAPVAQTFDANHPWAADLQAIIDDYARRGLPGIVVAVQSPAGRWEGTGGLAKVETGTRLAPGYVHAAGSVSKMYTAAAVLRLQELGRLRLDEKISAYLPADVSRQLTRPGDISVRMLLSHTAGVPDYVDNLNYQLRWYNELTKPWTADDALRYAYGKPLLFEPGTQYSYSNNNYVLLSLLINHVTGTREGEWLRDNILQPAGLTRTYYKAQPEYLERLPLPNFYFDRYGNGRVENITAATLTEIRSELGDGGLVATGLDFVAFMEALAQGRIVSAASWAQMRTPVRGEYGLGIDVWDLKGRKQYGHSGAVFGASAVLLYFDDQRAAVFVGSNVDADLVPGKTLQLYHEMKNKVLDYVAAH
ncbi:serine hydrolase domain-containing protein [Hymenobacter sp. B81]|uniref:serine hydrolase domain-containing protein n=1 Tax=Hymenobacter sp. B81 TaxID=3344878 RepID=UPI0037DCE178